LQNPLRGVYTREVRIQEALAKPLEAAGIRDQDAKVQAKNAS